MSTSQATSSREQVGELASYLSACAADLEQFLLNEVQQLENIQSRMQADVRAERHARHPGAADPAISAMLTRFEQLETAVDAIGG